MTKINLRINMQSFKPCLAAVGVGASFRLHEPHFNSEIDDLRSTKGWGSTSQGIGREIGAPVTGPQRGSVKSDRQMLFCF